MKTKAIGILSLTAVMLVAMMTVPAMAYNINGDLNDWGVAPSGYSMDEGWTPDPLADIVYVVENWYKGPNPGNHPGIEQCDIEAMYVDQDSENIYLAIITSMPPAGVSYSCWQIGENILLIPGDLSLTIDGAEYGVKLTQERGNDVVIAGGYEYDLVDADIGTIFRTPTWVSPCPPACAQDITDKRNIGSGTEVGTAVVAYGPYTGSWNWDPDGSANYVIEIEISKAALGITEEQTGNLLATESCANDVISIQDYHFTPIPEFTTIAIPVGMIFGLFYFYRRKRQSKEE